MKLFSNIGALTETVGPRNIVDDTMAFPLLIQRILGQNILNPNSTWKTTIVHHIASAALIIYIILGTYEILSNTTDIKDIAEAFYTYAIIGIIIIKYFLYTNEKIMFRKLYVKAKTCILDIISEDSHEGMVKVLHRTKRILFLMFAAIVLPVGSYVVRVFWYYAKGERVLISKTTSTLLPMTSPYYEIATGFHAIFMASIASTYVVIDMWIIFLMNLYCSASDCVVKIVNVNKEDEENMENYELRLNEHLRKFYLRHVKLVEYLHILNETLKWQSLVPLITVIVLSCIPMLSMSKEFDLTFATNITPTIVEVFVYNWFGEQIKTKSNALRDALIHFDWVNLQLKDKKNYYVIVSFMNKDFGVTTAFGSELSLITMTSVLKASYQAFTMLIQMTV
ncbi:uncharacterized protein LOC128671275 [Plodia interpunctella]|uniref:uncharacterized protein LOC128671275 n=1 Tax=Plodia interpunctella TaxID=58824 RepID=UPI00236843B2|nr:uncharacterized protein LOC128671275 [Plodia interpunctella]